MTCYINVGDNTCNTHMNGEHVASMWHVYGMYIVVIVIPM